MYAVLSKDTIKNEILFHLSIIGITFPDEFHFYALFVLLLFIIQRYITVRII